KQLNLLKENGTDMEPRKFELFWPKLQRLILILEKADLVADRIKKNQDVDHLKTVVDPASFISYALAIEDAIEFTSLLVEDNDAKKLFEDAKDKAVQAKIEVKRLENDLIDVVIQGQASIIAAWESARNEAKEAFAKADVGALSDSDRQASEEIKGVLKDAEEALDNLDDVFGKIIEVTTTLAATIKTSDKTGAAYGDAAQRFRELVAKYTEARGSVSDAIGSVEKAAKDKGSMSTIASALKTVNRVLAENILETAIAELRKATDNENSMRNDVHYNFYVLMRAVGFYNAIKSEDYNKAVVLTLATMKDYLQDSSQEDHVNGFHRDLHKYLAFTYNVASARDSKEVRKALEDAAMPVGGYRIKRKKDWTVTVNSYFGFVGGREKLQDVGLRDGYHFGPWVPVGLEVHFKSLRAKGGYLKTLSFISNNFEDGKIDLMRNFGLFVTIFDLGAIANYRLHNNEDENTESNDDPEVGFDQVFSPGIYYVNAVDFWQKKWQETLPASWGFGVQMTPRLRTVTEDGKETQANSLRFSFFIAMDIPIFTLY
ncbi:MAG: hypothetical protein ACE5GF_00685, partial [Thermodesulfobacteriota bacterium]